jgi:hypothetical protein
LWDLGVSGKSKCNGVAELGETHPVTHSLDDSVVSVDSGVNTLLPRAVLLAIVACGVRIKGLAVGHGFRAAVAVSASALGAVTLTVRDAHGTIVHESVGRKHKLNLPVAVSAAEKLDIEVTVLGDVLLADKDTASVTHISGGRARVLIVVAIELSNESLRGDNPTAGGELLRIIALPDLNLSDVI